MKHTYLVALSSAVLLAGISVVPAAATTPEPGSCTAGSLTITGTGVDTALGCSGVAVIPNSMTVIRQGAFELESDIHTIVFQAGSSLTSIEDNSFSQSGITEITIPASVTTIAFGAFALNTSLTSVTFETGSSLVTLGASAFAQNPALTSVTFRGMTAPTSVAADAFSSIGANPKLYLEDGATGFGSVGDTWKGLLIATGGTIVAPAPDPTPDPGPVSYSPAPLPPVAIATPIITKSFSINTPFLAKQQKKVLRTLIGEVGAGGSFEVVAGFARSVGVTKKQARALAMAQAKALKKYLVKRGVKKRDVKIKLKLYKLGASQDSIPETLVLGSKARSSALP